MDNSVFFLTFPTLLPFPSETPFSSVQKKHPACLGRLSVLGRGNKTLPPVRPAPSGLDRRTIQTERTFGELFPAGQWPEIPESLDSSLLCAFLLFLSAGRGGIFYKKVNTRRGKLKHYYLHYCLTARSKKESIAGLQTYGSRERHPIAQRQKRPSAEPAQKGGEGM